MTAWQIPVSIRVLIQWLQVQGCPGPVMDLFLLFPPFQTYLCSNVEQAVGPGVLQTFSTCAVKPKQIMTNYKVLYRGKFLTLSQYQVAINGHS